ncbi:HAD family hydrolase [Ahrensia kielensis]|uniref:HAD family phosphatase n=1 Tax=Ahrensia kielensis TaxID=76980 RepID=A0ABU9T972_9HYPH|nr:HAD family phosphatase [Ahrensia kielensis]
MTEIKHIVFDIGQILIHYDPNIPFSNLIPDEEKRQFFFDKICTSAWNIEQDRGRTWPEAEALLIAEYPDWETEIRAFRKHWHEMVSHALDERVGHLLRLQDEGHDVTLLTNFASDTFRQAQEMYPFLKTGRGVTVSGDVKLIKPDPAIYELHVETFDLEPSKTLFIDDSLPNIEACRALGWHGIHLTPDMDLAPELHKLGL